MINYTPRLLFINVELTLKCNLRCLHCGSTAGKARGDELQTREWILVMKQVAEMGCRAVCILGGEPLLTPGWFQIARAIESLGMGIVLITNPQTTQ